MQIHSAGQSDKGKKRAKNEDSFSIDRRKSLFVVADGMGGHAAGEVASEIAVRSIGEAIQDAAPQDPQAPPSEGRLGSSESLMAAIQTANDRIRQAIQKNQHQAGMGTTVVSVWIIGDRAYIGHVGDSRAYLIRAGTISQLTSDHTLVNEQVQRGILTQVEAEHHPSRNILTRAVGSQRELAVDITEKTLISGDRLLLCSDGLYTMVSDEEILATISQSSGNPEKACEGLIHHANRQGGEDNITVILLEALADNS